MLDGKSQLNPNKHLFSVKAYLSVLMNHDLVRCVSCEFAITGRADQLRVHSRLLHLTETEDPLRNAVNYIHLVLDRELVCQVGLFTVILNNVAVVF